MNKNQILKVAGEYADKYEKENGFTTHPKTASFHGYIAGYDDAKLATDGREELEKEIAELKKDEWYERILTLENIRRQLQSSLKEKEKECEEWQNISHERGKIISNYLKQIEELKAENERLRKYLEEYDKDYAKKHGIV